MPPISKNFRDIWNHSEHAGFLEACHLEIQKLQEKETFQVVNKSDNAFLLLLMWVFDYKFDDNGFFLKHKSKIMACGDLLPPSSREIYTNTLVMRAFCALAAIICSF